MATAVILGFAGLLYVYSDKSITDAVNYTIHVYDNGTATISVDNIGHVYQLQNCAKFGAGYYPVSYTHLDVYKRQEYGLAGI